jgi:hypothetical protein
LLYASYVPALEQSSLLSPVRTLCFVPIFGTVIAAVHYYRQQMLEMDKQLIFENPISSGF